MRKIVRNIITPSAIPFNIIRENRINIDTLYTGSRLGIHTYAPRSPCNFGALRNSRGFRGVPAHVPRAQMNPAFLPLVPNAAVVLLSDPRC
jgi:hypothetical protein